MRSVNSKATSNRRLPQLHSLRSRVAERVLAPLAVELLRAYHDHAHSSRMIDPAVLNSLFRLLPKNGAQLALENITLHQQIAVNKRTVKRPKINDQDRIFWLTVMGMLNEWREALVFVQPGTVIKWDRKGITRPGAQRIQ